MPAKDTYHNTVRSALEKDGWMITDDPLTLKWGTKDLFVDFGAQKLLAAQKNDIKIAVEVKSFIVVLALCVICCWGDCFGGLTHKA